MLRATEAFTIANEVNQVHDILIEAENCISDAAKEGKFETVLTVSEKYRNNIDNALKIIQDAGYIIRDKHIDRNSNPESFNITLSWKDANL